MNNNTKAVAKSTALHESTEVISRFNLRDHAVRLATQGFFVFPLRQGDKRPAFSGWQLLATNDPLRAHKLWSEGVSGDPLPFNVGIATGKGLFVVDIDNKNGKRGSDALALLELRIGKLPATFVVDTPTGGVHYYLTAPDGVRVRNSASRLGDGIDIKGDGGFVVGPGSLINGVPYTRRILQ